MQKTVFYNLVIFTVVLFSGCDWLGHSEPEPASPVQPKVVQSLQLEQLTKNIAADPQNPQLLYQRGLLHFKVGNITDAEVDFQKAIKLKPDPEYYFALSNLHYTNQDITRAMNVLKEGITINPHSVELFLPLVRFHIYLEQYDQAIKYADEALIIDANNAEAYLLKGVIFESIGDTSRAISSYTTAIEQDPKLYDGYMKLGIIYSPSNANLAIQYFDNALKVKPEDAEAQYGIAKTYQDRGETANAIKAYRDLAITNPDFEKAFYNLGYIYFQQDSIDKAEKNFNIAVSVAPQYADAYYMIGLCAEVNDDNAKAINYYDQTLKIKGNHELAIKGLNRLRKQN